MGENRSRTDNLIPFKPGQSGNPAGRPKGSPDGLRARLNRALRRRALPEIVARWKAAGMDLEDPTVAEVIVERLLIIALHSPEPQEFMAAFDDE